MALDPKISEILQYARQHGIARAYFPEDVEIYNDLAGFGYVAFAGELDSIGELDPDQILQREKLALDGEARSLLASILHSTDGSLYPPDLSELCHGPRKDLKIEVPLLQTDNELDVRRAKDAKPRLVLLDALADELLDSVAAAEALEQDICWSPGSVILPSYKYVMAAEKLEMNREALIWLQSALKNETPGNECDVEQFYFENAPKRLAKHITPPLTPMHTHSAAPTHSSPLNEEFNFMSECTSPALHEAKQLNETLMNEDSFCLPPLQLDSDALTRIYSPLKSCVNMERISSPDLFRAADFEVDETLLPDVVNREMEPLIRSDDIIQIQEIPFARDQNAADSQDDFNSFFHEVIEVEACKVAAEIENEQLLEADSTMRLDVPMLDFSIANPPWIVSSPVDEDDREIMLPVAMMRLHHISVSGLDRQLQWVPFPMTVAANFVEEVLEHSTLACDPEDFAFLGSDIDRDTLSWKPEGLRIVEDEDEELDLDEGPCYEDCRRTDIMKKRKIVIEARDLDSVSGSDLKRQRPTHFSNKGATELTENGSCQAAKDFEISEAVNRESLNERITLESFLGDFSASDELSRFMSVHTGKISKEITKDGPPLSHNLTATKSSKGYTDAIHSPVHKPTVQVPVTQTAISAANAEGPMQCPVRDFSDTAETLRCTPHESRPIIVSSALLSQQRRLLKSLRSLLPSLRVVTRDFLAWCPATENLDTSLDRSSSVAAQHDEADIQISPATGIILTTLQKTKQKPLPGQADFSALQARILRVCRRHERLFVLVLADTVPTAPSKMNALLSLTNGATFEQGKLQQLLGEQHGNNTTCDTRTSVTVNLEPRDVEALARLTTFTTTLSNLAEVTVCFVAATSQEPLPAARWLVDLLRASTLCLPAGLMLRVGSSGDDGNEDWALLQDETTWELLLRGAGFNAFAAQAVLLALRDAPVAIIENGASSEEGDVYELSKAAPAEIKKGSTLTAQSGLCAFVVMAQSERKRQFAGLMGGTRVLDRVGKALDGHWGKRPSKNVL